MRHFLLTDLEGPAGVWLWQQMRKEGSAKMRAMRLLTGEVAAATRGILEADPQAEVVVRSCMSACSICLARSPAAGAAARGGRALLRWPARYSRHTRSAALPHPLAAWPSLSTALTARRWASACVCQAKRR